MYIEKSRVESISEITNNIFLLKAYSPSIASVVKPGQFCNIKVSESGYPLLRRPFSICDVENDSIFFMFDIHGEGTKILATKNPNDELDILGPLGKGFILEGDYDTAIIIAGGIGAAPFPYLIKLIPGDKNVITFQGGRSKNNIVNYGMKNLVIATDDGSKGFHGNVVELFEQEKNNINSNNFRIFACGPNPMLKSLQEIAIKNNYDCQISVECAMACGFGICQGCPIDKLNEDGYYLVCKDGPVFNADMVKL